MTQYENPSHKSSTGDQALGSACPDVIEDAPQFDSAALKPTNVIELKPPSRRNFMSGAALLPCSKLSGGAGIHRGGSKLITLCEEFRVLERVNRERWEMNDPNFWESLFARQKELAASITARPPRSAAEFQALARALTGWFPGAAPFDIDDLFGSDCDLLSVLIRGLLEANAN